MNNTTSESRTYKGITMRVRKHWSGSTDAVVFYNGESIHFESVKRAKGFISSVTGK